MYTLTRNDYLDSFNETHKGQPWLTSEVVQPGYTLAEHINDQLANKSIWEWLYGDAEQRARALEEFQHLDKPYPEDYSEKHIVGTCLHCQHHSKREVIRYVQFEGVLKISSACPNCSGKQLKVIGG
jgi:hypothetical protein